MFNPSALVSSAGGDLVEAQKTGIKIVESPYVLSFKDVPKFFKPGLPFDLTVRTGSCVRDPSPRTRYVVMFCPGNFI